MKIPLWEITPKCGVAELMHAIAAATHNQW